MPSQNLETMAVRDIWQIYCAIGENYFVATKLSRRQAHNKRLEASAEAPGSGVPLRTLYARDFIVRLKEWCGR